MTDPIQTDPQDGVNGKYVVTGFFLFIVIFIVFCMFGGNVLNGDAAFVFVFYALAFVAVPVGIIWGITKLDANPKTRKVLFGFVLGLLGLMALWVFKLNGLF